MYINFSIVVALRSLTLGDCCVREVKGCLLEIKEEKTHEK